MKIQFVQDPHAISVTQILRVVESTKTGLSGREANSRLERFGKNALPSESSTKTRWGIFWRQWKSPLLYLLVFAAIISFVLGEYIDAYVVFGTAFVNAFIGFLQEDKANAALQELAQYSPRYVDVLRGGKLQQVESENIVVGDVIRLHEGSAVPADARIISAQDCFVDEAALTGESEGVEKNTKKVAAEATLGDRKNMVFAGTAVTRGKVIAVVTAMGGNTELGKIATLVKETKESQTPLQQQVHRLGKMITVLVVIVSVGIFVVGMLQGREVADIFLIAVAVGVAAIPEGLVISLTIILTIGMRRILAQQALTRRLVAAEGLGSVSVMCVDKTGTITAGKMNVTEMVLAQEIFDTQYAVEDAAHAYTVAALCTEAEIVRSSQNKDLSITGEPTEVALVQAAVDHGLFKDKLEKRQPRVATIAFDHARMYMATLHKDKTQNVVHVKGALESVLAMCDSRVSTGRSVKLSAKAKTAIAHQEQHMTKQGLRVLALAYAQVPKTRKTLSPSTMPKLTFIGLVGMQDPVRPKVPEVIAQARVAGVRTMMITGDHVLTAKHIAKSIGLSVSKRAVFTGVQLDAMDDERLAAAVAQATVFARVEPRHKIRIVQALQQSGEVVAMTGDGVNDAPAIKAADIGISVGSGSDVARNVADLVLLDNNVSTIVSAIEQGRVIFSNIRKVVLYLLSNMFTEVILVVGALLVFLPLPITAVQILWINFVTDAFPNMALAFDSGEGDVMHKPPRPRGAPIVDKEMKIVIFIISIVADLLLFLFFISIYASNLSIEFIQTMMFLTVGMGTIFYIYAVRSLDKPVWKTKPFANRYLLFAQVFAIAMLIVAVQVPQVRTLLGTVEIGAIDWLMVVFVAAMKFALIEFVKGGFRMVRKVHRNAYASS